MSNREPEELPFVPTQGVTIAPNPARDQPTRILETMIWQSWEKNSWMELMCSISLRWCHREWILDLPTLHSTVAWNTGSGKTAI